MPSALESRKCHPLRTSPFGEGVAFHLLCLGLRKRLPRAGPREGTVAPTFSFFDALASICLAPALLRLHPSHPAANRARKNFKLKSGLRKKAAGQVILLPLYLSLTIFLFKCLDFF